MNSNQIFSIVLILIVVAIGVVFFGHKPNKQGCHPLSNKASMAISDTKEYIRNKSNKIKTKHKELSGFYKIGDQGMHKVIDLKRWYDISKTYITDVDGYTGQLKSCEITETQMEKLMLAIRTQQDSVFRLAENIKKN